MQTKEIDNIFKEAISSKFVALGTKGICFKDKNKLIKLFYNYYFNNEEMISFLNTLESFGNETYVVPNELLIKDNKLIGYTERYIKAKTLDHINGNIYQIFNGFDKLVNDTKEISDKHLILNDLHYKNILFNDEYHIVDLDNCRIHDDFDKIFNHNMNKIMECILFSIFNIDMDYIFYFYNDKLKEYRSKKSSNYNYFYDFIEELVKQSKSENISLIRKRTCYESMVNSYLKPF